MRSPTRFTRSAIAVLSLCGTLAYGDAWTLTLQLGGYSASPLLTLSNRPSGLKVDDDGNVYLFYTSGTGGIRRVTPAGVESPWSSAQVGDLALSPSGGAIGVGAWPCGCLLRIEPNGSHSTFAQDSVDWSRVAIGADGTIFASGTLSGSGGFSSAVFQIDPLTEQRTLLTGSSSTVEYTSLVVGSDDALYTIKYSTFPERVLARFDGSAFTHLVVLPHGGYGLARGADGLFWVHTSFDYGSGYPIGEIWAIDSGTLNATLFAQTSWVDALFWGVGYDPGMSRLYIGDPSHRLLQPSPVLQVVTGGLLPTRSVTWGSIKALYRGENPGGR
jgi:hypothetical protein